MGSQRVRLNGLEFAYEERGAGDRALLLIHGYTGSILDFEPRLGAMAELGRCLALDLRGHGESEHAGTEAAYTLEAVASDLVAFVDAQGLAGCDAVGHSMGGMALLRAALAHPDRFGSLVLMDTTASAPEGLPLDAFRFAWEVARKAGMDKIYEVMRVRMTGDDPTRTEADRRHEALRGAAYWSEWREPNYTRMDPLAYAGFGRAMVEQESVVPRLGEIALPTLVMVGEGDGDFLAAADELEAGIPEAARVTLPEAAHQPQLEAPAAWCAAIAAHLRRVR